jgi:hypothetical protein
MNLKHIYYLLAICLLWEIPVSGEEPLRLANGPYEINGNRIVFTNWFYVRDGHFRWFDGEGKKVNTNRDAIIDPDSAHFVSTDVAYGIRIFAETPQRDIPIIQTDKPWDKWGIEIHTLIHENGKYRLWGNSSSDRLHKWRSYFESEDGIHWEKPNLGLMEFEGSRENSLIDIRFNSFSKESALYYDHPFSVFIDPNAGPQERYKTLWLSRISRDDFEQKYKNTRAWSSYAVEKYSDEVLAMKAAVSPDGFQWKKLPDPILFEFNDTQNIGYFDNKLQKYVLYTRKHMTGTLTPGKPYPDMDFGRSVSRRAIGRTESKDFRKFPLSKIIIETESDMHPADHFYTNCYTTIPGAPEHHLMFPTIYNIGDDDTDLLLYSSYDGLNWHRVPGPPILKSQPFGEPDGGCFLVYPNLVERPNGDWILPYVGYNVPHKYPRGGYRSEPGMLVWPKGRLVGIEAPEVGEFATRGFLLPAGKKLKINAQTQRTGYIKIEVVEYFGKLIEGYSFKESDPIIGDHHWTEVSWNGKADLDLEPGTPVWLRFKLSQAKIYGLEFE